MAKKAHMSKRMAATVILKNRHYLQGLNLTNLIKNIRDEKLLPVEELASFKRNGLYINSLTSSSENIVHLLAQFYMDYLYIDFSFLFDYELDLINNDDVNVQDKGGKTVLILACMTNDRKLLEKLLIHEADLNIVDNHGRSALQYIDLTNNVYDLTCFNLLLSHGCRQSFNQPCLDGNTIVQNVLRFQSLWQIDQTVDFIKFLVNKYVNLQLLTSDDGDISYGQLSLEEFSSQSRNVLRQILYLSGGSIEQITQVLHFEVEESKASLSETLREKPSEKLIHCTNNLSLKEICRRFIRQNTGLTIHERISELNSMVGKPLTRFILFKDKDSKRFSLPDQFESFNDDYDSYDLNKENDDYENDYLVYKNCKYLNVV
ncbi:hypothetical protein LOTGIDRAFT_172391 [Lottia gigantea]|uniref:Uncharacterized protein n=1 Tax=Lottia gigantea TaxID=225164 RepID=V4ACX7_LOTGI|nr:hypothetical protein LOTGIDRAFT_172391 [Lottia gigantea]ESP01834.1 hypothetical protein LOTGIDRAFT_172391 [Lottia gigantea]